MIANTDENHKWFNQDTTPIFFLSFSLFIFYFLFHSRTHMLTKTTLTKKKHTYNFDNNA